MKLALGFAQFDNNYNILLRKKRNNANFKKTVKNAKKIFLLAKNKKINVIDAAIGYKNSAKILGKLKTRKTKIITKIPKIPKNEKNVKYWVKNVTIKFLKDCKIKSAWAVLIHYMPDLNSKNKYQLIEAMKELKKLNYCSKIGISIVKPTEIKYFWKIWKPDIIELPINVVNRNFLKNKWLKKFKQKKIIILARSVLLQGLLINRLRPKYFKEWSKMFEKWHNWCDKNSLSPLSAALNYVFQIKEIDKIIVGVENKNQLEEILKVKYKKRYIFPDLSINNNNLIDPYYWKI